MPESALDLRIVAVTPDDPVARERGLPALVAEVCAGGATALMFREKSLDDGAFAALGRACREICRDAGVAFLLNERLELAAALDADAVHLTHRSPTPRAARRMVPPRCLLGRSLHAIEELEASAGCDYFVFGPVMSTPSKAGLLEPRGFRGLGRLCRATEVPVVAIGGLAPGDVAAVRREGGRGLAAMRALFGAERPRRAAAEFLLAWQTSRERRQAR